MNTHLMSTVRFRNLCITGGKGATLHGAQGRWVDFFGDVGTASLGYGSPEMFAALETVQRSGIAHSPVLFSQYDREMAADELCSATGFDKVFFCNSGAESVEAAIKLARLYQYNREPEGRKGQRYTIWSATGGFHGRTLATLAAGDGPPYHTRGFHPLPDGFEHFLNISDINPEGAAAVLLAPVYGNNDVRLYSDSWLKALRVFCDENGILLIFDEVQTGAGRCGAITYASKIRVQPDILTLGKGIAMGAPLGATLARGEVANEFTPGSHFSTFGGNPLCCAFLRRMLDFLIRKPHTMSDIETKGRAIEDLMRMTPHVLGVRRTGMLIAADLDVDTVALAEKAEKYGMDFGQNGLRDGVLLGAFRSGPGPLKITPPLNISMDELMHGVNVLREILDNWEDVK